jgi:hypothetical protein
VSNLENRYRRLLRVLPAWYRAEREEEMVGLFLADRTDDLDLEHGWPGWGETGATVALGVRTRFAASDAPARAVAVGDVVRLVAMLGVLVHGAYATRGLMSQVQMTLGPVGMPEGGALATDLALLVGSVAMVAGFRGVTKALFGVLSVLYLLRLSQGVGPEVLLGLLWQLPLWLTVLALFAGFHRDAPAPALNRWRWAMTATVLSTVAMMAVAVVVSSNALYSTVSMAAVPAAAVVAGLTHLIRRGTPTGAVGLGVWIATLLPIELAHLAYSGQAFGILATSMVAVGAALLVVGTRGLRRPTAPVTP